MEIFIFWIALSIVAGVVASNKGRSGAGFFLLSLILSPVIGVIAALVVSPHTKNIEAQQVASGESRKCPYCAELVKSEAAVCRFCNRDLPPPEPKHQFEFDPDTGQRVR